MGIARRSLLGFIVGSLAATAAAQSTTQDDFEGKLLQSDMPPGIWGFLIEEEPANFFGTVAAAAKTGSLGLRNVDTTSGSTNLTPNGLVYPLAADAGTGQHYHRVWFRGSNHNLSSAAKITSMDLAPLGLPAAEIYYSDKLLELKYFNRVTAQFVPYTQVLAADGQWVLIEMFVTGVGTANGTLELSLDGQLKSRTQGIDWTGQRLSGFAVGNLYSQGNFQATLDFDGYRAARLPQASRLVLSGPAVIAPGVCAAYAIEVLNGFDAGLAPLVGPAVVALSEMSDAGVVFSTNGSCSAAATSLSLADGVLGAPVFVRAAMNGQVTLAVQSPDFPDFALSVLVDGGPDAGIPDAGSPDAGTVDAGPVDAGPIDAGSPDAGSPDAGRGPATLAVGCGCQGDAGSVLLGLFALLGMARRRTAAVRKP